ncbi:sensor domain-containing protein [Natrarchaeobius sp. A-rgal3]|uniref:sensor domain-containing protein n=1 Tax=Natrarchaeobius versutus TaxID=1679078 RepID=UPI00350F4E97
MNLRSPSSSIGRVGTVFRSIVASPFRPQTYRNLLYLLLVFPLGTVYFVFLVAGLSLGVGLSITLVGIPILLFVLLASHGFAAFERELARRLLGVDIVSPSYAFLEDRDATARVRALVLGRETYAAVGYLASKFVVGIGAFVLVTLLFSIVIALLAMPLYYDQPNAQVGLVLEEPVQFTSSIQLPWDGLLVGLEIGLSIVSWEVTSFADALAFSAVGVVALVVSLAICNAVAWLLGQYTRLFLGRPSVQ